MGFVETIRKTHFTDCMLNLRAPNRNRKDTSRHGMIPLRHIAGGFKAALARASAKKTLRTAALVFLLLLWFLGCARKGLFVNFYGDDMMNLNRALVEMRGFRGFISILWPYTAVYRPVGALYYKLVYLVFGLHPLAFRSVTYVFLFLNVVLAFCLAWRFSRRWEVAFLTAMLWAYHHRFDDIYFNNGTVYDVLCFTFYFAAFLFYVRVREKQKDLKWRQVLLFTLLFVLALNSKEMAVTLPVGVAAWEIIYRFSDKPWLRPGVVRSFLLTLALSAAAALVKAGPQSAFYGNAAYKQNFTIATWLTNNAAFLDQLTLKQIGYFTPGMTVGFFFTVIAVAFLFRSRAMFLGAVFAIIATLPVSFIPGRGFFAVCISYFGWTLYAADAIVIARDGIISRRWEGSRLVSAFPVLTSVLVAFLFLYWQKHDIYRFRSFREDPERQRIHLTLTDLERAHVCPPGPNGSLLFVRDRWPDPSFQPVMVAHLVCHDPDLNVDLGWVLKEWRRPINYRSYTWVLDYKNGQMIARRGIDFVQSAK
jgi:hypothetical protein